MIQLRRYFIADERLEGKPDESYEVIYRITEDTSSEIQ